MFDAAPLRRRMNEISGEASVTDILKDRVMRPLSTQGEFPLLVGLLAGNRLDRSFFVRTVQREE